MPTTLPSASSSGSKQKVKKIAKKYHCGRENCSKSFQRRSDLDRHDNVHTQKRPHRCHVIGCGKRFNQKGQLKIHINTHTGQRPYACSDCGKKFADPASRSRHKKESHDLGGTFCCSVCTVTIKRQSKFREHLRGHGIDFDSLSVREAAQMKIKPSPPPPQNNDLSVREAAKMSIKPSPAPPQDNGRSNLLPSFSSSFGPWYPPVGNGALSDYYAGQYGLPYPGNSREHPLCNEACCIPRSRPYDDGKGHGMYPPAFNYRPPDHTLPAGSPYPWAMGQGEQIFLPHPGCRECQDCVMGFSGHPPVSSV